MFSGHVDDEPRAAGGNIFGVWANHRVAVTAVVLMKSSLFPLRQQRLFGIIRRGSSSSSTTGSSGTMMKAAHVKRAAHGTLSLVGDE